MSTMLRSLKFVRRLSSAGGTRLGYPLHRLSFVERTLSRYSVGEQCLASYPANRNYVTKAAAKQSYNHSSLDTLLNEIDRKIRYISFIKKRDVEEMLQLVTEKGSMTSSQALLLIRCCGDFLSNDSPIIRRSLVNQVWDIIKELNIPVDVSHYNALLLVNLENETDFSPLNILLEMKEKKIEPNRVTFQRLIEQYCNKGDIAGATKILEHMHEKELPVNENIFNSLIKGHSEANDISSAIKVLDLMSQAGIHPTSRSYATVLCAHAKQGDIEAIRTTLKECGSKDILLSDKEILNVIYELAINGYSNFVDEMMAFLLKGSTYNRDAITYIHKLIEKNQEDIAFKLLKSLVKSTNRNQTDRDDAYEGHFFIRKLISTDSNVETIIKFCKIMKNEKMNPASFEIALFNVFANEFYHLAFPLIKAWKECGGEIREHYFYPLFISFQKANNLQGVINTMKTMIFDYDIQPTITTVKDYILPCMVDEPFANLSILVNNNLPFSIGANAIILHLLSESKTKQAAKFMLSTRMAYNSRFIERPLAKALDKTKDINSIIDMLHYQYVQLLNNENKNYAAEDRSSSKEFVSNFLVKAVHEIPKFNTTLVIACLNKCLEKGLSINQSVIDIFKVHYENIEPEIENLLNILSTKELQPAPLLEVNGKQNISFKNIKSIDIENTDEMPIDFKMTVIQQQAKMRNEEVVEKLLKEVIQENATFTEGFCANLIDFYAKLNNLEEAQKWYKKACEVNPNFKVDKAKMLNYVHLLIKNNLLSEALQTLETPILDPESERSMICERILATLAEKYPDDLEKFFSKMLDSEIISKVTINLISPVVKVPLENNDIEKALERFKWACEKFKLTPVKMGLMTKLIDAEDAKSLQIVTDLNTQIYGQNSALFDLAIAFYECGRERQARKIFESPDFNLRQDRVMFLARKYAENYPEKLEGFIQILSGLYADIDHLYFLLLQSYDKLNDWSKCLALWTQMQEDNIQPSTSFMNLLEKILKKNGQSIPFVREMGDSNTDIILTNFHDSIVSSNLDKAEKILQEIPSTIKPEYTLQLIKAQLMENDINNAIKNFQNLLTNADTDSLQNLSTEEITLSIIRSLTRLNDFATISELHKQYHQKRLKSLFTSYNINETCLNEGKYEDFINYLENMLESEPTIVNSLFHTSTAVDAIYKQPELKERLKNFSNKCLEKKVYGPINTIWVKEFLENSPEADQIFKEYLKPNGKLHSFSALYALKDREEFEKIPHLVEKVQECSLPYDVVRRFMAGTLKVLLESNSPKKYELAYESIRQIANVISIDRFNQATLQIINENLTNGQTIESLIAEIERTKEKAIG